MIAGNTSAFAGTVRGLGPTGLNPEFDETWYGVIAVQGDVKVPMK